MIPSDNSSLPPPAPFGENRVRPKQLVWISVLLAGLITHEGEKGLTILRPHRQTSVSTYIEILAREHTHTLIRGSFWWESSTQLSAPCLPLVWWLYFLQTHSTRLHLPSIDWAMACLHQNHAHVCIWPSQPRDFVLFLKVILNRSRRMWEVRTMI